VLRLAGITTVEAANRYLAEYYIHEHNARFTVQAAEEGSAFVPFAGNLRDVLCIRHERVVGNDNCVRYGKFFLQIPEQAHRRHFVKTKVKVHEYPDGTLAIFHGPRKLADYGQDGALKIQAARPNSRPNRSAAAPVDLWRTPKAFPTRPTGPTAEADI
jgi:hypothetical protein